MKIVSSWGMRLTALWFILYGIAGLGVGIPGIIMAILALIAGILLLIGV